MNYLFLLFAILTEIVATTSLKLSDGFTRLIPSIVVVIGYAVSFYLLSLSLRGLPLGTAYAIWSGLGTALTVVVGIILWQEAISPLRIVGILTIIAGVVLLKLADSPASQTMSQ